MKHRASEDRGKGGNKSGARGRDARQERRAEGNARREAARRGGEGRGGRASSKRTGELAELAFMYQAARLGFVVAKPYGDSERYDQVVDAGGGRFVRVQVKGSNSVQYGAYLVNMQRHANGKVIPYDASEIDFLAAFVMPEEMWFVIPVKALRGRKSARVCLNGDPEHGEFGKYWEAWNLLWRKAKGPKVGEPRTSGVGKAANARPRKAPPLAKDARNGAPHHA
jgi:hypothetical protein